MIRLLLACISLALLAGCQKVYEVEYYEPTQYNVDYSIPATSKRPGLGPIKMIKGKSGSIEFSDNKSFSFSIF